MTDREKTIVMAYTGYCMLAGDKLSVFYEYVESIMGRPVYTHEMGTKVVDDLIKEKSRPDFIALCADEGRSEKPCTDAISRQAAIDALTKTSGIRGDALKALYDLPPVKPQYTDAEIQKMQDLESVEIQTAYEIGKEEAGAEILDKIRAEIEALEYLSIEDGSDGFDKYIEQYEVLKIIDKYKTESEDRND